VKLQAADQDCAGVKKGGGGAVVIVVSGIGPVELVWAAGSVLVEANFLLLQKDLRCVSWEGDKIDLFCRRWERRIFIFKTLG